MHRSPALASIALFLSLAGANELLAQRSGFIIGFGLGVGATTYTISSGSFDSDRQTDVGLATDFKIGAQVSPSFQVYYLGRTNWFNGGISDDLIAAGLSAVGVTYVLPSAPIHLSGGIGFASWVDICVECSGQSYSGVGLTGGFGWEFADLWLLDVGVTYAQPGDVDMFLGNLQSDLFGEPLAALDKRQVELGVQVSY